MVIPQVEHRLDREASVLAPDSRCRSKLVLDTAFPYDYKQPRTQDLAEDLGSKVHEVDAPPLVRIAEVTALGDWHDLAFVPFGEVDFLVPVGFEEVK